MTHLGLSDNQLTALPPGIGELTNLIGLYLTNNRLTALPTGIGELTNLAGLDLGNNQLTALPPGIGELTNLARLYLFALHADYAFIRAWNADTSGNLQFRLAQRNFNPIMATAARITIVEVS